MSKRARHRHGAWRPRRPRKEVYKAVAAGVVIVGATAGIIYTWPTGSGSGTTVPTVTTAKPKTTRTTGATTTRPATPTTSAATTTTKAGAKP